MVIILFLLDSHQLLIFKYFHQMYKMYIIILTDTYTLYLQVKNFDKSREIFNVPTYTYCFLKNIVK
jgi:hypothetical protein